MNIRRILGKRAADNDYGTIGTSLSLSYGHSAVILLRLTYDSVGVCEDDSLRFNNIIMCTAAVVVVGYNIILLLLLLY